MGVVFKVAVVTSAAVGDGLGAVGDGLGGAVGEGFGDVFGDGFGEGAVVEDFAI